MVARWDFCGHFWQFPSTAVCLKLNPSLDLFLAQQGWIFGGLGELLLLHSSIWRVDTFIGLPGIRPNISSSPTKSILAHLPRLLLQLLLYPRPLSLIYFFLKRKPEREGASQYYKIIWLTRPRICGQTSGSEGRSLPVLPFDYLFVNIGALFAK